MWTWWLKRALLTWVAMTALWGAFTILLDSVALYLYGHDATISWQVRTESMAHRVIPAACGFLVWGLAFHFWLVDDWPVFDVRQPIHAWFQGGFLGMVFVWLFWLQHPVVGVKQ